MVVLATFSTTGSGHSSAAYISTPPHRTASQRTFTVHLFIKSQTDPTESLSVVYIMVHIINMNKTFPRRDSVQRFTEMLPKCDLVSPL